MTKRVLLAEDDPNISVSLKFILEKAEFEVTVIANGREALEAALATPPDVLILDVMLPEMNGYDILREIRADARVDGTPVLMLTAKGQREDRETALECGADLFITKPYANTELVEAVRQLAGG